MEKRREGKEESTGIVPFAEKYVEGKDEKWEGTLGNERQREEGGS